MVVCAAIICLLFIVAFELSRPRTLSRELPPRGICASNLRGIGQGLHIYAADQGAFPADLGTLIAAGIQIQDQFQCPVYTQSKPGQSDYRYVTGLTENDSSNWIIAFDEPGNHPDGSGHVLYIDGHVEYHRAKDFAKELDRFRRAFEASRGHTPTVLAHELLPPNKASEP